MSRFRAAPAAALRIVPLDALTLIFHRPSGQTHVVAPPVPEILAALGGDALDATALLARLAAGHDLIDGDMSALVARLDELAAVGLVARA